MKTNCSVKQIQSAFSLLSPICPSRSPSPILSHLRLSGKGGSFTVQATDLEVWAQWGWRQDVSEDEAVDILLPSASVGGILREMPEETVQIEVKNRGVEIRGADTYVRIPLVPPMEFPSRPEFRPEGSFQVDAKVLVEALRRVEFSAAREKTRYALNGVLLSLAGKAVEWVATDGRRLAMVKTDPVSAPNGTGKAIVGLKMASLIARTFGEIEGVVTVSFDKRFCRVEGGGLDILGRLVEGVYPDYRAVIPKDLPERLEVGALALERAIRKATLVTSATSGSIGWKLSRETLEVTGQSSEEGEARITLKTRYEGKDLSIRFNPRFLLEILKAAPSQDLSIHLKDATSAGQIQSGEDALYIILPVHLVS